MVQKSAQLFERIADYFPIQVIRYGRFLHQIPQIILLFISLKLHSHSIYLLDFVCVCVIQWLDFALREIQMNK